MKKRETFKRWTAMLLTVVLLFNQIPVSAIEDGGVHAQEEYSQTIEQRSQGEKAAVASEASGAILAGGNGSTSADMEEEMAADVLTEAQPEEADLAETGQNPEEQGTHTSDISAEEEAVIDNTAEYAEADQAGGGSVAESQTSDDETAQSRAADGEEVFGVKVNADLEVEEIAVNQYELHMKWQVTGAQGEVTALALGMDKMTYESLPESAKADENGICHIQLEDGSMIAMGKEMQEEDEERILLVYEQAGDGNLSLDIVLSSEAVLEEQESVLTAQWLDENVQWTVAAQAGVQWKASAAESEQETESERETSTENVTGTEETEVQSETETESETESETDMAVPEMIADEAEVAAVYMNDEIEVSALPLENYFTQSPSVNVYGKNFEIKLYYKIHNSELQTAGTNKLVYTLPDNIIISENIEGKVMQNNSDKAAGEYAIDKETRTATITFYEDFYAGTPTDITATLGFWATVDESSIGDDHNVTIKFRDDYSVTVPVKPESGTYDVSVDKQCQGNSNVDQTKRTATCTYTLDITSTKGTGKPITVSDYLSGLKEKGSYSNIVVTKYDSNNSVVTDSGNSWTGKLIATAGTTESDPKFEGELPKLEAGERYHISYDMTYTFSENSIEVSIWNEAKVQNEYVGNSDSNWTSIVLYDSYVRKTSENAPAVDKENKTITNSYKVIVGTNNGTQGALSFEDVFTTSPELPEGKTVSYTVKSVKKHNADGTAADTELPTKDFTLQEGKLTGTLPALAAGEYYEIIYDITIAGLSDDEQLSFDMKNKATVTDQESQKNSWGEDSDHIEWVGKNFCDWISKIGSYDASKGKITWTITLNAHGYGNIDGKTLEDFLAVNGGEEKEQKISVTMTERSYKENIYGQEVGKYKAELPIKFEQDKEFESQWNEDEHAIDTTNEFVITYETTVDPENLTAFENVYVNRARLDGYEGSAEVKVPVPVVEKSFVGSSKLSIDGIEGAKLDWVSYIDILSDGLKEGSYYTDEISDYDNYMANNNNWFTKDMIEKISLSIGDKKLVSGEDYEITVDGRNGDPYETYNDSAISGVKDTAKIWRFKITFLKDIKQDGEQTGGAQVKVSYSSFVSGTAQAYNTGTYTSGGVSDSDRATGKGDKGGLLQKMNADGSESGSYLLSSLKDATSGKNILVYKLIVNNGNSAAGDITITDILPEGTSLVQENWQKDGIAHDGKGRDCINGVLFHYYEYNAYNTANPYTNNECEYIKISHEKLYTQPNDEKYYASKLDIKVEYDNASREMTIKIPKAAYHPELSKTENNETYTLNPNLTMVLYYAVEVSDEYVGDTGYEKALKNTCTAKSENRTESSSVENTICTDSIGKAGVYNAQTNTLTYEVDINPKAVRLKEGQETTLTVEDTLNYGENKYVDGKHIYFVSQVEIGPGSLKLYEYDENGKEVLTQDKYAVELKQGDHKAVLKVEVPDGKHYKLKYDYIINFDEEGRQHLLGQATKSLPITNYASISGQTSAGSSSEDKTEMTLTGSSATASKEYTEIKLYKHDKANQLHMLEGAVFQLEYYNGLGWTNVGTFTTGEDGSVQLGERLNEQTCRIGYDCAYRLREIKAPEGYQLAANDYYFFVRLNKDRNIVPEGWNTDSQYTDHLLNVMNGYIFLDNEKQADNKTSLEVEKVWKDVNGKVLTEGIPKKVDIELWAASSENNMGWCKETVTLSEANGWHYVWAELDKYQYDGTPCYYYVKEKELTGTGDEWYASYSNDKPLDAAGSDRVITVTNQKKDKNVVSFKAVKEWLNYADAAFSKAPEDEVTVRLKRKFNTTETAETPDDVKVTVIVNNSGMTSQKETEVPYGASVTITMESSGFNHFEDMTTITPAITPVYSWTSADKGNDKWVSVETMGFRAYADTTVTIGNAVSSYDTNTLTITPSGDTLTGEVDDDTFEEVRVLSAANNWSYTWENLPEKHPAGFAYTYEITEDAIEGYDTRIDSSTVTKSDGEDGETTFTTATITNKALVDHFTDITVKKQWKNADTDQIITDGSYLENLSGVVMQLYQSAVAPSTDSDAETVSWQETSVLYDEVTLSSGNGWAYSWRDLPRYKDRLGKEPYYYYVVEKGVDVAPEIEGNGANNGTITVTNTVKTTSVTVSKKWYKADGTEKTTDLPSGEIKVQLYRKADTEDGEDEKYGDEVSLASWRGDDNYSDNGWTYTWPMLPEGSYYVVETSGASGYKTTYKNEAQAAGGETVEKGADAATAGGKIIVENTEDMTGISVEKVWSDGNENHANDTVKMRLYSSTQAPDKAFSGDGEIVGPYNVKLYTSAAYEPKETYEGKEYGYLASAAIYGDSAEIILRIKYWSTLTSDDFEIVCSDDSVTDISGPIITKSGNELYTVRWEVKGICQDCNFYISLRDGVWPQKESDNPASEIRDSADAIKPYQKPGGAEPVGTQLLCYQTWNKDALKHAWTNLPKTNSNGEPLYYYVVEESGADGYVASYKYDYYAEDGRIEKVTITNTPEDEAKKTSIRVEKKWVSADGTEKTAGYPGSVTVELYKADTRKKTDEIELGASHANQTGYDTTGWSYTWSKLDEGSYYVKEKPVEGYTASYQLETWTESVSDAEQAATGKGTITITNKEEPTSISVEKAWSDGNANHADDTVIMQLYSSTEEAQPTPSETKTSITVKVDQWSNSNGSAASAPDGGWIWVKILPCSSNGDIEDWNNHVLLENLSADNGWTLTKEELSGTTTTDGMTEIKYYYIQYGGAGDSGNTIGSISPTSGVVVSGAKPVNTLNLKATLTESASAQNASAEIASYSAGDAAMLASEVGGQETPSNLVLPDDAKPVKDASGNDMKVTLGAGQGWKYTWSDLPKTDAQGNKIHYYVKEISTGDYTTSYTYGKNADGSISTVTVTNTVTTMNITVNKQWEGYRDDEYSDYTVTVALMRDGAVLGEEYNRILTAEGEWSAAWSGLPKGHTYSAEEISVTDSRGNTISNFDTQMSESLNTDGTITITNTKKKQGIVLPGTGSKYPLVFYGLGTMFLLISMIWMFLTFKKSNIPIDTGKGGGRSDK